MVTPDQAVPGQGSGASKFKIVFLGDQYVGKTSFINRFLNETFDGTYQVF